MDDNQLIATNTAIVVGALLVFALTVTTTYYQYNCKELAFREKMMSNGYVQVIENGYRLWKPAGVKIEAEKK